MKKRAEEVAETHLRITEAAIDLHGSIGPSRTTLSAVAKRAGVERRTLHRHFPTEAGLFAACSAHYFAANPWPDLAAWRAIRDPSSGSRVRSTSSMPTTSAPSRCSATSCATRSCSTSPATRWPRWARTSTKPPTSWRPAAGSAAGAENASGGAAPRARVLDVALAVGGRRRSIRCGEARHRAESPPPEVAQGVQSAPRCTNGSPGRQRSRNRRDRRAQVELAELGAADDADVAHRRVGRRQQRGVGQRNGVDDVHDVAARAVAGRRDRLRQRDRHAGRQPAQAALLGQLAAQGGLHRLAGLDSATGQEPVGPPRLLVPHEHERVLAAVEEPADAQPWRLVAHTRPLDPKPCSPRALAASDSRTVTAIAGSATTTSCAMRMPGSTRKASDASVLSSVTRSSPR